MADKVIVSKSKLQTLGNAIRSKTGTTASLTLDAMASEIANISMGITPTGTLEITDTNLTDVTSYANAQVVDSNLIADNIKKDVSILGITGTYEGESGSGSGGTTLKKLLDATKSCYSLFNSYQGTSVDDLISYSDTENVTDMWSMFADCQSLQTIPQLNTNKVTDMTAMFDSCYKLQTIPQLNTNKVTNMTAMFDNCKNLQTIPQLDTGNVTNMYGMFQNCQSLQTIPQLDTSNVTDMWSMFADCKSLQTIPQLNTNKVTNMGSMFDNCKNLQTIPQLDTGKVTNMSSMFAECQSLQTIPQLNTNKVTNMGYMFNGCDELQTIDLTSMDKITSTNYSKGMCQYCYSLTKFIIRTMTKKPALNSNSFTNCYHFTGTVNKIYNPSGLKDGRIYVPDNMVGSLKSATNWSTYADIIVPLSTLQEE